MQGKAKGKIIVREIKISDRLIICAAGLQGDEKGGKLKVKRVNFFLKIGRKY